jgi:hypothetical protein
MADVAAAFKGEDGIAFLVAAGLMLEGVAAYCSSPQTTELNAKSRAGTLMKWVHLGIAQSYLLLLVAAYVDKRHRWAILGGGTFAGALIYGSYVHARAAGLASSEPGTESY